MGTSMWFRDYELHIEGGLGGEAYDAAKEWLSGKLGFAFLDEVEGEHEVLANGCISISLGDEPYSPFIGNTVFNAYDIFEEFVDRFCMIGSWYALSVENDKTTCVFGYKSSRGMEVEYGTDEDLHDLLRERVNSRLERRQRRSLVDAFGPDSSEFDDVRIWDDYSDYGTAKDIRGYRNDDEDDPGELIGFYLPLTEQALLVERDYERDPKVMLALAKEHRVKPVPNLSAPNLTGIPASLPDGYIAFPADAARNLVSVVEHIKKEYLDETRNDWFDVDDLCRDTLYDLEVLLGRALEGCNIEDARKAQKKRPKAGKASGCIRQ